ncbi:uncharacterized protein Dvir_GJ26954 [Drosophila virilis]|uniref:Uncharacterized protein n=1 Tax=Drosophila virilis TaxID=7244 RepID=A0A0Q9WRD1_DROVI|nr:uncharacterized protein Dvir_GJ26954 [Drosophila virilis]
MPDSCSRQQTAGSSQPLHAAINLPFKVLLLDDVPRLSSINRNVHNIDAIWHATPKVVAHQKVHQPLHQKPTRASIKINAGTFVTLVWQKVCVFHCISLHLLATRVEQTAVQSAFEESKLSILWEQLNYDSFGFNGLAQRI